MKKCLLYILVISFQCFSQTFQSQQLIDTPGNNSEYDLYASDRYPGSNSFVTWINQKDNMYTIFLKILPDGIKDNIILVSDANIKTNPRIVSIRDGVRIGWQEHLNGYSRVLYIDYINGSPGEKKIVLDSLTTNPQFTLSRTRIAWIKNDSLFIRYLPYPSPEININSGGCASPELEKNDDSLYSKILYLKNEGDEQLVIQSEYNIYSSESAFTHNIIGRGHNNIPKFGLENGTSFEFFNGKVWKIMYAPYYQHMIDSTSNINCNFNNAFVFSYLVPVTKSNNLETPFFVAFDTDSLQDNKEILIKTFYFETRDSLINISDMAGNDHNPKAGYMVSNDTTYVIVLWLHDGPEGTSIWMAKTVFDPIYNSVEPNPGVLNSPKLFQNYPNPFNPATNINFYLDKASLVNLKLYDVTGREVSVLLNEWRTAGEHKILLDASGLVSGVYFIKLQTEGWQQTRKISFIK